MSTPPKSFDGVLGPGRGLNDARVLRVSLARAERDLITAASQVRRPRTENARLADVLDSLHDEVDELKAARALRQHELAMLRHDYEYVRYRMVAATGSDPRPGAPQAQGPWGPGRPYLGFAHVTTEGGDCYQADYRGVPADMPPRTTSRWTRCDNPAGCPQPPPLPLPREQHPMSSGRAIRGTLWVDADLKVWNITPTGLPNEPVLSDAHLVNCLAFLKEHLQELWWNETRRDPIFVPCPPNCFSSASEWLAATPLHRALVAEASSRGLS